MGWQAVVFVVLGWSSAAGDLILNPSPPEGPQLHASVPPFLQPKIASAFWLAQQRLDQRGSCRDLFGPYAANGVESLSRTVYSVASANEERQLCRRRVSAFTRVGGSRTRICRSFARLSQDQAATILIHEALHAAGMPESPSTPEALSSREINALVDLQCR